MAKADALRIIRENVEKYNRGEDARVLDLGNCGLRKFPEEALECVWVEELILSGKWWGFDFENNEGNWKTTQNHGRTNKIESLSPNISKLSFLNKLVLANMPISDLSPLSNLINLQQLDCNSTSVRDLSHLSGLTNLKLLYCSSTPVSNLWHLTSLINLQQLHCSSTQINDLSPLSNLVNLQHLYCDSTAISGLSSLAGLADLQSFSCAYTHVIDLSPIEGLTNMQLLSCRQTRVTNLSPLAGLTNLLQLYCNSSQIADLSPLADLTKLEILECSNTKVTNLSALAGLINLQILDCSNTKVSNLSPVSGLTNLHQLYCASTQITDLSPILYLIQNGVTVKWQGFSEHYGEGTTTWDKRPAILIKNCPLTTPPIEIAKQGNDAIIQWFNAKNKRPTLEAKVMFIGDSGFGKTHLIELLRHGRYTRTIDTTLGIERNRLAPAESAFGPVRLNVWDLGGQEFMRSTHQFFFTTRTIYVLVTDARQGERREGLLHWLNLVKTLGEGAPVLVVINKIDTNDQDVDRERIRHEFPNVVGFVRTCAFDKAEKGLVALDTIRELKHQIDVLASDPQRMPSVFYEQREEWFTVKEALENTKDPYITIEAYRKLEFIRDLPVEEQDGCLKQLNFVGSVVSYFDDARLSDTHVIDPKWIMDGVYAMLNDYDVKDVAKGRFDISDMSRILPPEVYPKGKLVFLTDLMQKFKLCYPQRGSNDTFLLPDLFPDTEPAGIWEVENPLRFRFNYDNYPPDVFMAQFIAAKYRSIEDEKRWRGGVIICDGQCRAIIRRSFSRDHIEIEVVGPERQRRGFLRMVREVFYELHEPYSTLKPLEEIPYKDQWLNYWDLLKAESDGDPTYRITGGERIPLTEVLDGYAVDEDRAAFRAMDEKMNRILARQDELMEVNFQQLDLLLENKAALETYFQTLDTGIKLLLENLPANHPIADQGNAYLKAADLKLKYKLGHQLLGGEFEAELNVDAKKIFKQLVKDAKQIVKDFQAGHIFTKPNN